MALLVLVTTPVVASAQIYVKRDANGTLVLSDRPLGEGAVTYAIRGSSAIRTTRQTSAPEDEGVAGLIEHHSRLNSVRPDLVRAVIAVESAFNPRARSPKGAMGLMQLMPATARRYDVDRPYDPAENIRAGVKYLRTLLDRYSNNEELALAAYNAGPGAVDRYGVAVPPYRETRDYVRRIKGKTELLAQRAKGPTIYRVTEVVDGREIQRYTNVRPGQDSAYEVVTRPRAQASGAPPAERAPSVELR
jgi:hypothetical protein